MSTFAFRWAIQVHYCRLCFLRGMALTYWAHFRVCMNYINYSNFNDVTSNSGLKSVGKGQGNMKAKEQSYYFSLCWNVKCEILSGIARWEHTLVCRGIWSYSSGSAECSSFTLVNASTNVIQILYGIRILAFKGQLLLIKSALWGNTLCFHGWCGAGMF